jgi:hypothetical protein
VSASGSTKHLVLQAGPASKAHLQTALVPARPGFQQEVDNSFAPPSYLVIGEGFDVALHYINAQLPATGLPATRSRNAERSAGNGGTELLRLWWHGVRTAPQEHLRGCRSKTNGYIHRQPLNDRSSTQPRNDERRKRFS